MGSTTDTRESVTIGTMLARFTQSLPRHWGDWVRLLFLFVVALLTLMPFVWVVSTSLRTPAESFTVPPEWIQGASQAGPRGDMVALVDWMTGQVMDTLDELGIAHDTLLVLTSDNGARLADVDGDTRFPNVDWSQWRQVSSERHDADTKNDHPFSVKVYQRVDPLARDDA